MSNPGPPSEYPPDRPFAPVDPYQPVDYPQYPPPYQPPQPPYPPQPQQPSGYQPPPPQPPGYGYPPATPYPGAYNPYQPGYPSPGSGNNGMALASLITSIAGLVVGVPLTIFCYIGFLIPVVGTVLGIVALNQIKQTGQQGRGMAIAGIVIGGCAIAITVIVFLFAIIAIASTSH